MDIRTGTAVALTAALAMTAVTGAGLAQAKAPTWRAINQTVQIDDGAFSRNGNRPLDGYTVGRSDYDAAWLTLEVPQGCKGLHMRLWRTGGINASVGVRLIRVSNAQVLVDTQYRARSQPGGLVSKFPKLRSGDSYTLRISGGYGTNLNLNVASRCR